MTTDTTKITEPPTAAPSSGGDDAGSHTEAGQQNLGKRLLVRSAIAVALILILLGGLALLDETNTPAPPSPPASRTAAGSVSAPSAPGTVPATQLPAPEEHAAAEPPLPATTESTDAAQETTEAPTTPETTRHTKPLPPAATASNAPPRLAPQPTPLAISPSRPTPGSTATPAGAERKLPAALPATVPDTSSSNPPTTPTHAAPPAPASRPISRAVQRAAGGGYLLQLGVFHNTASAEELRATLELNGIPAQIESRVQVGPFANRAEAEQAREKLKKLGLEGGMLVTTKK